MLAIFGITGVTVLGPGCVKNKRYRSARVSLKYYPVILNKDIPGLTNFNFYVYVKCCSTATSFAAYGRKFQRLHHGMASGNRYRHIKVF